MFAFEVEYLLARSFAGSFTDRDRPEWPPHPVRLFSALAAAYFENGAADSERHALEWLEKEPAPHIHALEAGEPVPFTAFVPANYVKKGDYLPAIRNKQPRSFPAQTPECPIVHFIWPTSQPDPEIATHLDNLASRTAYLGRSSSMIRMRVTPTAPDPNYEPSAQGDQILRVPTPGRLEELKQLYQANQRATLGTQRHYRRVEPSSDQPIHESTFGHMDIFARKNGPKIPIEASLTLTAAVRDALMANAGKGGPMTALLHGHDSTSPHCAIAPLPFAGWQHADGRLMGFAVIYPRQISLKERHAVFSACMELCRNGLRIPNIGNWELEIADASDTPRSLLSPVWTRQARVWKSVTPILLDRFPKKNGLSVEEIIALACRRVGLPEPKEISHQPYSDLEGVPPVPEFRLRRKVNERPRWGVHATLTFEHEVRGPLLFGAGRFFGLGLMKPVK